MTVDRKTAKKPPHSTPGTSIRDLSIRAPPFLRHGTPSTELHFPLFEGPHYPNESKPRSKTKKNIKNALWNPEEEDEEEEASALNPKSTKISRVTKASTAKWVRRHLLARSDIHITRQGGQGVANPSNPFDWHKPDLHQDYGTPRSPSGIIKEVH